jgi:hypothetical protein
MSRQTCNQRNFQSASLAARFLASNRMRNRREPLHFRRSFSRPRAADSAYFRCFATSLVISNMFTVDLPPNTPFSTASALIIRLFFGSWSLFFLM